jgi:hypothetical protein
VRRLCENGVGGASEKKQDRPEVPRTHEV